MNEHANCLEQILTVLQGTNINETCPTSEIIKITPFKDDFFNWTPNGRREHPQSLDGDFLKKVNHSGVVPPPGYPKQK